MPRQGCGKADHDAGDDSPAAVLTISFEVKITLDQLALLSADQIRALFEAAGTLAALRGKG